MNQEDRYKSVTMFIQQNGPALPIDITQVIGKDSMISNAFLSEMTSKGLVKRSNRQIGNSLLYFLPGQEGIVRKRLSETLNNNERALIQKFERERVIFNNELEPMERYLMNRLLDFLVPINITFQGEKLLCYKTAVLDDQELHSIIERKLKLFQPEQTQTFKEPVKTIKQEIPKRTITKKTKKPKKDITDQLLEKAVSVISSMGGNVIGKEVVSKNREIDVTAQMGSTGTRYLFKIRNKKTLTEKDLSLAFAQVMDKKKPIILLVTGTLSKAAQKFKEKSCGELVKVIEI